MGLGPLFEFCQTYLKAEGRKLLQNHIIHVCITALGHFGFLSYCGANLDGQNIMDQIKNNKTECLEHSVNGFVE